VVLIDFWATWCQPCKKEMPGYQKLLDQYGPQGFVVIGFKFDTMQDTEDPVRFTRKIGVHYPLAVASDDLKLKFGGIEGLPTTMLYDRQGTLRQKVIGFEYTDFFEKDLIPLLQAR
jgi:thiol-disulfide isomerase/thioredoxin